MCFVALACCMLYSCCFFFGGSLRFLLALYVDDGVVLVFIVVAVCGFG